MSALLGAGPLLTAQHEAISPPSRIAFTPGTHAGPSVTTASVSFSDRVLTFSGLAPGEQLALFALSREARGKVPVLETVVRAEILSDSDGDGVVRFELPLVPIQAMWAAVGLTSGAHAAFPTPGYEPRRVSLLPDLVRNDNAGHLSKVEWPFSQMDIFVVRPGEGAWRHYASKASALDENKDNGKKALRLDLSNMTPVGNSPEGPRRLRNGDIVAVIDRYEMQYGILEVGR